MSREKFNYDYCKIRIRLSDKSEKTVSVTIQSSEKSLIECMNKAESIVREQFTDYTKISVSIGQETLIIL